VKRKASVSESCIADNGALHKHYNLAFMEPIPYFFDTVNRSGIGVKPKRPLLDWINALYPDMIELNERHTDEADWPQKRNYKLFKEWFDTQIYSMVVDIEESPLRKS